MKISTPLLLAAQVILCAASALYAQDTLQVLFVGNSYTYYNDLPVLFTNLAGSGGHPVSTGMSAPGGYTLEQHTTNQTTLSLINRDGWNYVVLQEQSQYPTIPYYRINSFFPAARTLDSIITANGEQTAFFMTWGRKHGGQQIINGYSSYPFADFFQMQDTLAAAYSEIATELSAPLCPVGNCWAQALSTNPLEDLWQTDYSHPTLQGSYLAACAFYTLFFNESPMGLTYTAGLAPAEANFLQWSAWQFINAPGVAEPPGPARPDLQIIPNPFNLTTVVSYELRAASQVSLRVYDVSGELVTTLVEGMQEAGVHEVTFDGLKLSSGIYFVRLQAGEYRSMQKLVLMK